MLSLLVLSAFLSGLLAIYLIIFTVRRLLDLFRLPDVLRELMVGALGVTLAVVVMLVVMQLRQELLR